jgi:hypothetical protein
MCWRKAKNLSLLSYAKKRLDKIFSRGDRVIDHSEFDDTAHGTMETSRGDQLWRLFGLTDDVRVMRAMVSLWDHEQSLISPTADSGDPSR